MRAFQKLTVAAFKQFFRDKTALFFTFAFPILFMLIFGLVFSSDEDVSYKIGVVHSSDSPMTDALTQSLKAIPIFEVSEGILDDKLRELEDGDLRAVVAIPGDIDATIGAGNVANITVYYDPSQTTSSQIILSVLRQSIDGINRQLTQEPLLIGLTEQSISSQNLRGIDFLVPGILAMSIMFLGLFGGLPLVDWREKHVLKRLGATPVRRSTVIISQVFYRLILAVIQAIIIIIVASLVFNVQVVGSWLLLFGLVLLGTLTLVALGYALVARARTTEGAMPIIQVVQFPMMFLSGIFFPVEFIPDFMRPVVEAMPVTYLGDALRQVMVDGTPLHSLGIDVAVLAGWLVACMALSIRFFRWE